MTIPPETLGTANTVLTLITAVAAIGWGWLVLKMRSEFTARADHDRTRTDVGALGIRVAELEAGMRLLPGHETVRTLTERVGELHSDLSGMGSTLEALVKNQDGIRHQLDIVQQHLLADRRDRNAR